MPRDGSNGHGRDSGRHAEAELLLAVIRCASIRAESVRPNSPVLRGLRELVDEFGPEFGLAFSSDRPHRLTLLDAKTEIDARVEDHRIPDYAEDISPRAWRGLVEGTSIRYEEIRTVAPHFAGRHLQTPGLTFAKVAAGCGAYGMIIGAYFENQSW